MEIEVPAPKTSQQNLVKMDLSWPPLLQEELLNYMPFGGQVLTSKDANLVLPYVRKDHDLIGKMHFGLLFILSVFSILYVCQFIQFVSPVHFVYSCLFLY